MTTGTPMMPHIYPSRAALAGLTHTILTASGYRISARRHFLRGREVRIYEHPQGAVRLVWLRSGRMVAALPCANKIKALAVLEGRERA